jgi:membrane protease YdiL (CAAX protease family)
LLWAPGDVGAVRETVALIGVGALLVWSPFASLRWFRRLQHLPPADESARLAVYRKMQRRQVLRVVTAVGALLLLGANVHSAGLLTGQLPVRDSMWGRTSVSLWVSYLAFVLVAQMVVLAVRGRLPGLRRLAPMLPRTRAERLVWVGCSIGAGVSEEIWYRGMLPIAILTAFPHLRYGAVLLAQALLFGVAHVYQRVLGVVGTSVLGYLLGLLVLATGSIWLVVVIHVVIDARFAVLPRRVWQRLAEADAAADAERAVGGA